VARVNTRGLRFAVLVVVAALAGCGGGSDSSDEAAKPAGEAAPNIVQPGAPGQPTRTLTPEDLAEIPPTPHSAADVRFMQGMIHHHAQALQMTNMIAKRGASDRIALLGRRIDRSQEAEIAQMRKWLRARGEPAPVFHRRHGHAHGIGQRLMPGMLTLKEMDRLAASRGAAFDRLFLRSMIRHHQGALTMVQELYDSDGGLESEVDAFARHVVADQEAEIQRMQALLTQLR
jgi:uncharacterized protein (DUF305 family)